MNHLASIGFVVLMAASGASQAWAHGGGGGMGGNSDCSMERGQFIIHFSAYQHATAGAASQLAQLKDLKDADLKRYVDAMKQEFQSYCRDIPNTGKATLTFDLISDGLRGIPVAVRVVEASERSDSGTVLYIPQQVYPSGVVRAETEFAKAGKYQAIVEVQEHHADRSPLVGAAEAASYSHDGVVAVSQKHATVGEEEAYHAHDSTFSFPFTVGLKSPRASGGASSMMSNPAILVTIIAGMGIGTVLYVRRRKKAA